MNKKSFFTLVIALMMSFAASAQIKRVAILETIDKEDKVPYAVEVMVRSNLNKVISNTAGYEGYDRVNISEIMDEHDFERTGLVNEEQIKQLGEMSGADFILVSEAVKFDESNIYVTAKILNVETAKTESAENELMGMSAHDIQHGCESLANRLLGYPDPYAQEKDAPLAQKKPVEKPVETPAEVVKPAEPKVVKVGRTKVGDLIDFPDGSSGLVFYVGPDGKGLAVSLSEGEEPWDNARRYQDIMALRNFSDEDGSLMYGVGEGYTRLICSALGDGGRAAFWCRLQGEGWYLPSAGELFTLVTVYKGNPAFQEALKKNRGGELRGWYWSSSENDRDEAWNISDKGSISTEEKDEKNKVRAIKAFSE